MGCLCGAKKKVEKGALKTKKSVIKAAEATKDATMTVVTTVESSAAASVNAVVTAGTKVVESLEDVNLTGFLGEEHDAV